MNHLPAKGPYLICPNHESYLDRVVLLSVLPYRIFRRMFFLGYSVIFKSWFMKPVAHLTNIISVDPDAHLLRAMKAGASGLRSGLILCIFPEGGRSYDGELQEFKKGAAILSRELSVPIVPTAIRGTHQVWPRDSVRIRPHKVSIEFGQPLFPSPKRCGRSVSNGHRPPARGSRFADSLIPDSRFQIPIPITFGSIRDASKWSSANTSALSAIQCRFGIWNLESRI